MKSSLRYSGFGFCVAVGLYLGWAAQRSFPLEAPLDRWNSFLYPDRSIHELEKWMFAAPAFMIPAGETKRGTAPLWTIFYSLSLLSITATIGGSALLFLCEPYPHGEQMDRNEHKSEACSTPSRSQ
jgi:hypothetical protein